MSEQLIFTPGATRTEKYKEILPQIISTVSGESDLVANLANVAAILKEALGFFWVGFYLLKKDVLVLGPFQGPLACTRIAIGKGVCGTSAQLQQTLIVPDVEQFPGHIACSSLSKSEIVVPLVVNGKTEMVLDVDSDQLDDFSDTDRFFLEQVIQILADLHWGQIKQSSYFAHPTAVIDEGAVIGEGSKIWHFTHVMAHSRIGKKCNLGQNIVISPEVILGDNVKVQNNVSIYTGVICEDDVFLGPSMVFTNVINPRSGVNRRDQYAKTTVKKGASIGANATIVCGNEIGEYAFIGAGAVVTRYVPAYALVVGNPARQVGWMSEYGHRLHFNDEGKAQCPESGEMYQLQDGIVSKISRQEPLE